MSDKGYLIRWANCGHGDFFNAWSPSGKHIDAGYDKEKVKAACADHLARMETVTT